MAKVTTFTSESVCAGHPDKICDAISDAVVDAVLAKDPYGHVAVETLVAFDRVVLAGEVTLDGRVDFKKIAKGQLQRLGYVDRTSSFSDQSAIEVHIHEQSPDIAGGIKRTKGAGDQGMMFGFACRETESLMPLPIDLAHALTRRVDQVREQKQISYLKPDGKSQVTIRYEDARPVGVEQVVVAVPYEEGISPSQIRQDIFRYVVQPVLSEFGFNVSIKQLVLNGTGVWHIGGPVADTGVTGRKIVVDGYGGYARVGGGAFSGKDPTKVDRSGAYAARFIAKNVVANKLAERAEVRLAYFIGAVKPVMQEVETYGTAKVSQKVINDFVSKILDTSVEGILEGLKLRQPIYLPTASYGHFGRVEFPWEKVVLK